MPQKVLQEVNFRQGITSIPLLQEAFHSRQAFFNPIDFLVMNKQGPVFTDLVPFFFGLAVNLFGRGPFSLFYRCFDGFRQV